MDSLSRALVHGVTLFPSNSNRTTQPLISSSSRLHFHSNSQNKFSVRVLSSLNAESERNPIIRKIKSTTGTLILTAATLLMIGKFSTLPARAESPIAIVEQEENPEEQQEKRTHEEDGKDREQEKTNKSNLPQFLESNPEAIDALKSLVEKKLDLGEDEEALAILKRIVAAQPSEVQWKFLMARVLSESGQIAEARQVFDEILSENPFSFEALFQNSLLMDQHGEGEAAFLRLKEALKLAEEQHKVEAARYIRLIMAQLQFLQKNVDEALESYQQLANEDPTDYRPYFCRGCIYTLLEQNDEAKKQFAKCHELNPEKFEVKGYVQTPMSRSSLFTVTSNSTLS